MAATFNLRILASDRDFFEGRVIRIVFQAPNGQRAIEAHHYDAVFAVEEGPIHWVTEDEVVHQGLVGAGMVEIMHNRAMMLVMTAERPEEVDRRRAEEALAAAQEQMRQKQSIQEYKASQAALARALSRLKETSKYS